MASDTAPTIEQVWYSRTFSDDVEALPLLPKRFTAEAGSLRRLSAGGIFLLCLAEGVLFACIHHSFACAKQQPQNMEMSWGRQLPGSFQATVSKQGWRGMDALKTIFVSWHSTCSWTSTRFSACWCRGTTSSRRALPPLSREVRQSEWDRKALDESVRCGLLHVVVLEIFEEEISVYGSIDA